jgi:hypothetical protein
MRSPITAPEATVRDKDGKTHQIDKATMMAATERARKYLEEAVRWGKECKAYVDSGAEDEMDTRRHDQFRRRNHLEEVWFSVETYLSEADRANVLAVLHHWTKGTLEDFGTQYAWMEEDLDLDPTYLLFGLPIYQLPVESQQELHRLGAAFAGRACSRMAALN